MLPEDFLASSSQAREQVRCSKAHEHIGALSPGLCPLKLPHLLSPCPLLAKPPRQACGPAGTQALASPITLTPQPLQTHSSRQLSPCPATPLLWGLSSSPWWQRVPIALSSHHRRSLIPVCLAGPLLPLFKSPAALSFWSWSVRMRQGGLVLKVPPAPLSAYIPPQLPSLAHPATVLSVTQGSSVIASINQQPSVSPSHWPP